jgi:hypothetical protein
MNRSKHILQYSLFILAFGTIATIFWLIAEPSESSNAAFAGLSLQRLGLITGLIVVSILLLVSGRRLLIETAWFDTYQQIALKPFTWIIVLALTVICWVGIFLPDYLWGGFTNYKNRLLPIIVWMFFVCVLWIFQIITINRARNPRSLRQVFASEPGLSRAWLVSLASISVVVLFVAISRVGLIPDIVYWNNVNVPLLGWQILAIIFLSIILVMLPRLNLEKLAGRIPDVLVFLLIWGIAVLVWTQTTGPHSFFAPGPYPPNGERYPFSDAAGYDINAQFAVIGEGLGTQTYVDKPLYVAFLTLIHLIVGNRMDAVVGLQIAVIALLPAVIYLLGRKIHSKLAGLLAAGLIIFREINNINGTLWVLSTNSQVLMSESLVSLLLAFSVLFFAIWIGSPDKKVCLMASGGSLGLAGLSRLNPFLLLPVFLFVIMLFLWKQWKKVFINCVLFLSFFAAAVLPWMIQSWIVHDNFIFFRSTMRGVVVQQRTFYSLNEPVEKSTLDQKEQQASQEGNRTWNRITGISRYVSAHFMHNLISNAAIFPVRLELESLERTVKSPGSFWSPEWKGYLPPGEAVLFSMNIIIISLGLAGGWSRRRWAGLVPAGFLLAYSLATSAVRTSGGRYILPADWVGIFYFAIGVSQLFSFLSAWMGARKPIPILASENSIEPSILKIKSPGFKTIILLGIFLLIGGTPVILDRGLPKRYQPVEKNTLAEELERKGLLNQLEISRSDLDKFLDSANAVAYRGRGLYPKFYEINKGEPDQFSASRGLPFPRLVMTVIGPQIQSEGILPLSRPPENLPNGSDVLAIGCTGEMNDDWLALVVEVPVSQVILRSPDVEWVCPIKPPVCDDNRVCQ